MKRTLSRTLLVAVLALPLVAFGVAYADDASTEGSVVIGAETVDGRSESSKFQEYREVPNGPFLEWLDFGLDLKGWGLDLQAIDIGQEDQRVVLRLGKPGTYRVTIGYDQTPKWFSNTTFTPFALEGSGRLVLPFPMREDLQARKTDEVAGTLPPGDPTTAEQLELFLDAARPVDLRYRRDTTTIGFDWTPMDNARVAFEYQSELRDGTRPQAIGTYFSNGPDITEFAAPLNYTTQTGSASFEYATSRWHAGAEVAFSQFSNDVSARFGGSTFEDALVIDNPMRIADACNVFFPPLPCDDDANGANSVFLVSTPPDNEAQWITLSGGVRVSDWGKVTAVYSMGSHKQDQTLLPFSLTTVPELTGFEVLAGGVAQNRFDGDIDITHYDVKFTGRPVDWVNFKAFARSYEYDTRTPEYTVTDYVVADTEPSGEAHEAFPFAWKKDNLGAEARFRPPVDGLTLTVGLEQEDWDREFRRAPKTSEDILRFGADYRVGGWGWFRASYEDRDRENDGYVPGPDSWIETRMFDQSNRQQDRLDLSAQITPHDRVALALSHTMTESEYDDDNTPGLESKFFGRTEDEISGWSVDVSVMASDSITLYADYSVDDWEFTINSRYRPIVGVAPVDLPDNDWTSTSEDEYTTYGLGLHADLTETLSLKIHGMVSEADGTIRSFNPNLSGSTEPSAIVGDYPDVSTELTHLSAMLKWKPRENVTLGFGYIREEYDADDWARDSLVPWMGAVDPEAGESIYLGWRVPDYDVDIFRVLLKYSF